MILHEAWFQRTANPLEEAKARYERGQLSVPEYVHTSVRYGKLPWFSTIQEWKQVPWNDVPTELQPVVEVHSLGKVYLGEQEPDVVEVPPDLCVTMLSEGKLKRVPCRSDVGRNQMNLPLLQALAIFEGKGPSQAAFASFRFWTERIENYDAWAKSTGLLDEEYFGGQLDGQVFWQVTLNPTGEKPGLFRILINVLAEQVQ